MGKHFRSDVAVFARGVGGAGEPMWELAVHAASAVDELVYEHGSLGAAMVASRDNREVVRELRLILKEAAKNVKVESEDEFGKLMDQIRERTEV